MSVTTTDFEEVKQLVRDRFTWYMEETKADELIVCLTCPVSNWRNKVLPSYKGNRKGTERPLLLEPIKQFMAEEYKSFRKPTLEADDCLGILSTHPKLISGKKIIISEDKDLKSIPGWLWNPAKDKKPYLITPEEADYWHMLQTLMGDTTDGYTGCPGVGKDTADELLKEPYLLVPYEHILKSGKRKGEVEIRYTKEPTDDVWASIVSLYNYKGFTEEDALTQARVARICRHTDYNFKTQEPIYWTPKKK